MLSVYVNGVDSKRLYPSVIFYKNDLAGSSEDIFNLLAKKFESVYSVSDLLETEISFDVNVLFSNILLDESYVLETIHDLDEKSGLGSDNVHLL